MRFEVIGTGAMGLLFGGGLCTAGEEVRMWTRTQEQARLLRKEGFSWITSEGIQVQISPDQFQVECSENMAGQKPWADWILITTKQRSINSYMYSQLQTLAGPHQQVACLQNGIGHIERISEALGGKLIWTMITTEGARRLDERTCVRSGVGYTRIGTAHATFHTASERIQGENLSVRLNMAGFPANLSNDIEDEVYRKLLINAAINPLTAIWRIPNGELLMDEHRTNLVAELVKETLQIYDAYGINHDEDLLEQVFHVIRATAANQSSMLKDVMAQQETEIDNINGTLVKMAASKHIQVPHLHMVWRLVAAMPKN